jgi:hypothetical protein
MNFIQKYSPLKVIPVLLLILAAFSVQVMANGYPRYVFPPLENSNGMPIENQPYNYPVNNNRQHYNQANMPRQNSNNSYFRQPKYIFPELEQVKQAQTNSKYNFPVNDNNVGNSYSYNNNQIDSQESYQSKGDNTFSRFEQDFRKNKNYSPYDKAWYGDNVSGVNNYRRNSYKKDSWTNGFDMFDRPPSPMGSSFPTNSFFGNNSFMNPNFGSQGYRNKNFGNNRWNPISSSQSMWPSTSNRSYDSDSLYTNPNIRIPGFFSR